jgi:hypothetical protein
MSERDIPAGLYCYTPRSVDSDGKMLVVNCLYWGRDDSKPYQSSGYCAFLKIADWTHGTLLWDQVKECNVNMPKGDTDEQKNG